MTSSTALDTFRDVVTLKDGVRVLFRPLIQSDYEGLVALFAPLSTEDRETMRQNVDEAVIRGWIESLDYDKVLPIVAEVRHEIIGQGTLHYGQGPYRHIADVRIFLAKAWRRRGVGTHLLQTLIHLARRQGLQILTAEVIASHTHVIKAFEALGFQPRARLDDHFMLPSGQTLDVVLMVNPLVSHRDEF